jgi:hypothetical protein
MYSTQHTKRLSNRTFGLALAIVFAVMFVIGWLSFDVILVWPLIVAMCLGVIALVVPWVLLPLNRLWHALEQFPITRGHSRQQRNSFRIPLV